MSSEKRKHKWLSVLKKAILPIAALLALVILIMWTTGVFREQVPPGTFPREPGFALPAGAETFEVKIESVLRPINVTGTVFSEEMIHVAARINAYVREVHAGAGSKVAKDDILISLDDRELRQQLSAASAELEQAETEYNRTKRLFESGAATHRDFTAAQSDYKSARAHNEEIEVMLSFTRMRSPIDGVVTDRNIEAGDLASPGQVLMTVYNPAEMRLEVPVPVRLSDRISLGDRFPVKIEYPEGMHMGIVTEIVSKIDPASRTRTAKVSLPLTDKNDILPGTFGRIWIDATPEEAIFIPETAVYRLGQLEMVQYVVNARVIGRLVKTGPLQEGYIEILSGLSHGDIVLVHPVPSSDTGRRLSPVHTQMER